MRLSCFEYGIDIFFDENCVNVLVLENPKVYTEVLNKLLLQISGEEQGWQFSYENRDMSMGKNISVIHSPFLLELNSKKNLTFLYKELRIVSDDCFGDKMGAVNSVIVDYLDILSNRISYPIDFNIDLDVSELFKMYNVHFDFQEIDLLEKVLNYMQLEKTLCGTKLIVFINFKSFFDKEQIREIYKSSFYNKLSILMIESDKKDCIDVERYCIIDKDKCLIQV